MDVRKLQFAFTARDFDASTYFYETVLGMKRITSWDRADGKGIVLSIGGKAAIEIYGAPEGKSYEGPAPTGMDIVLEVDDVDAWYERIKALIPVEGEPQIQHWDGRNFFVHDPDGVPFEIYTHLKK